MFKRISKYFCPGDLAVTSLNGPWYSYALNPEWTREVAQQDKVCRSAAVAGTGSSVLFLRARAEAGLVPVVICTLVLASVSPIKGRRRKKGRRRHLLYWFIAKSSSNNRLNIWQSLHNFTGIVLKI